MLVAQAPDEIRPDFRFDQDDRLGMDHAQRAIDAFPVVDRIVNLLDARRQFSLQFAHAGRGGGGDDDFDVGHARLQCADELCANIHFPDTHGVHPEHMTVGQRLLESGVETAEPLAKAAPPVAAPPHFQKVVRRGETEENRKQNVVKGAHGLIANLVYLSLKPVGLPSK